MLESVIIVVHLLVALTVIVLVLVQHGKGADMGASFGSGASNTVFGSQGSANFLSRTTAVLVAIFFITSVSLTYYAKSKAEPSLFAQPTPSPVQQPKQSDQQLPTSDQNINTAPIDHTPAPANTTSSNKSTQDMAAPANPQIKAGEKTTPKRENYKSVKKNTSGREQHN